MDGDAGGGGILGLGPACWVGDMVPADFFDGDVGFSRDRIMRSITFLSD